ncbi:MAG: asparaginase [Proteobacteria bacterium]|nr:asparaginase [Pseudomonadota bacterium]
MSVSLPKIKIVLTGGTIDSFFDPRVDSIKPYAESRLPDFFKSIKPYMNLSFVSVCMKDSRELTKTDLNRCVEVIEGSTEKMFLLTHGTYTMPDTARFLAHKIQRKDAVVILTGAMMPLYGFDGSDAQFNLGYALGRMMDVEPGVYVAIHGRLFKPEEVSKTLSEGRFTGMDDEE